MVALDLLIRDALQGKPAELAPSTVPASFLRVSEKLGVSALLHAAARRLGWPDEIRESLRARHLEASLWELAHLHSVRKAVSALDAAGLVPLVIKGTALAYSVYPDPATRLRGDADLLVGPGDRDRAWKALLDAGFAPRLTLQGKFAAYETTFIDERTGQAIDLHWRFSNGQFLADAFPHGELLATSHELPGLHRAARAPSPVLSLLIGALHRALHLRNPYWVGTALVSGPDRLIWLVDIDLLARGLDESGWNHLASVARGKCLQRVLDDALTQAHLQLGTPVPPAWHAQLREESARSNERSWMYVRASKRRQRMMDFAALPGARARLRFLRETLWPDASYMRARYGSDRLLPVLYLTRLARGLRGSPAAPLLASQDAPPESP